MIKHARNSLLLLAVLWFAVCPGLPAFAQGGAQGKNGSHTTRERPSLTPFERELVDQAIGIVCSERQRDPKASMPIDQMQARPSLPTSSPAAQAGAERAQNLLPVAKELVITSLRRLAAEYQFPANYGRHGGLQQALLRVQGVTTVKADVDARDNASVYLSHPHTINFGTIFLAGLPSDEGMISVLAHELTHIADGERGSLARLFRAIGERASELTGMQIREQRAEELSCDLVGTMAARAYVNSTPNYEPLPRRIARSLEHNCVDQDEGDEDHLSPRSTIRSLLTLNTTLVRELVSGREEPAPARPDRR